MFTIAIYFWCSVAALAFVATLVVLVADYVLRVLRAPRRASHDEIDAIDEAPRSTVVPVSVAP